MIHRPATIVLFVAAISLLLPVISLAGTPQAQAGSLLWYEEQEAGIDAYPVRILVVPGYLRMDDGQDDGDFLLFDRNNRRVFSINHEDRSILVIEPVAPGTGPAPPPDLELGVQQIVDESTPLVAGKQPEMYRFTAAGETCLEAVVVPGLLPQAVQALSEYSRLLAERQQAMLENTPEEFRTPCFLSRHVHAAGRQLEQGLPIQEWDSSGYRRQLTDFRDKVPVNPELFELPAGYNRHNPGH